MMPKMIAPSGRIASATVRVNAISGRVRPKDLAMSSMTRVRMKKSNASSVQPRNPASTAFRWFVFSAFVIVATVDMDGGRILHDDMERGARRARRKEEQILLCELCELCVQRRAIAR